MPHLWSDLSQPSVLVREPGPRGYSRSHRDPACMAGGKSKHPGLVISHVSVACRPGICLLTLCLNFNPCRVQSTGFLKDNSNAAQRLLDGVNLVAQSVSELSVKPAKAVTSWLTDQIAPAYWKPNSLILVSDTHSPAPLTPATNCQVNTFVSRGMFVCGVLFLLHNLCLLGHKIKLG